MHGHINTPDNIDGHHKTYKYYQSAGSFHKLQIFYMDSTLIYPQFQLSQIVY